VETYGDGIVEVHRIPAVYDGRHLFQHLICSPDSLVLIDTGIHTTPDELLFPYVEQLGRSPGAIDWVITTHCDADHCGGNSKVREQSPRACFVAQTHEAHLLEDVELLLERRYLEFEAYGLPVNDGRVAGLRERLGASCPVDLAFGNHISLNVGHGCILDIYHAPGHTMGHLIVVDRRTRTGIITDAILGDGIPYAQGGMALPPTYRHAEEYLNTLGLIEALNLERLLPSHFPVIQGRDEILKFTDKSRSFVLEVENFLVRHFEQTDESDLPTLIEHAEAHLGSWPSEKNAELGYCFLGGLERLVGRGCLEIQPPGVWKRSDKGERGG
jgi:glyoxylase-like metal-dependent hydrolase (beta-lactamase superfamily II)